MLLGNATSPLTSMGADFWAWQKPPESYRADVSDGTREAYGQWPYDWPEVGIGISPSETSLFGNDPGEEQRALHGQPNTILVAALSRGNVSINSSSIPDQQIIHTKWLAASADQEMVVPA